MKSVKEFLEEKVESKAEKEFDKIVNSPDGEKLLATVDKEDRKAAKKILMKHKLTGDMLASVLFIMFDDM